MLGPAPRAGLWIGFDVAVNDNDKGQSARDSQSMWNGNGMEYTDPQQFGMLVLETNPAGGEVSSVYACGSGGAWPLAALLVLGLLGPRPRGWTRPRRACGCRIRRPRSSPQRW
jgi:hypothetical protein